MFSKLKLFVGALALIGASAVMACDCGSSGTRGNGTTRVSEGVSTVVGSEMVRTYRSPATDVSYSSTGSAGRGAIYSSGGSQQTTTGDYPRMTARGASNESYSSGSNLQSGNGNGRGRN